MNLPFRKPKPATSPTMPPEVQQYYQAERRERTGIAWLLAIATLLITVAIILGLFFGGRWVYRKIRNRNTSTTSQTATTKTTTTESGTTSGGSNAGSSSGNSSSNKASGTSTTGSTSSGAASTNSASNGSSTNSTPSAGGTTSNPPTSPGGVVGPTAARTNIPNTGPGDTIAIFFGVSVLGYLVHRYLITSKN